LHCKQPEGMYVSYQWSSPFLRGFEKKRDCLGWKEILGIKEKFHKIHIFDNYT